MTDFARALLDHADAFRWIFLLALLLVFYRWMQSENGIEWRDFVSAEKPDGTYRGDINRVGQCVGVVVSAFAIIATAPKAHSDFAGFALVLGACLAFLGGVAAYAATLRAKAGRVTDRRSLASEDRRRPWCGQSIEREGAKVTNNQKAFLDMLAFSEGTVKFGNEDGYDVIVGGSLFDDYSDHPRKLVDLPRLGIKSTAAGRYQLLARYYDAYKRQLGLPDFSPESQDAIALQQIKERRALDDIEAGRFASAVEKCRNIWASLPGAGYGQHEHKLADLQAAYEAAGGTVA